MEEAALVSVSVPARTEPRVNRVRGGRWEVGSERREARVSLTLNAKRRMPNAKGPLGLQTLFDLNDARERVDEVLKSTSRKHDGVPTPTNIFRDFQKPSAFVLFEIEKEDLAINLNLLGRERFIYLVWCVVINHDLPFSCSLPKDLIFCPPHR